jgi:membrane protease YdiL (CAAX protease family)
MLATYALLTLSIVALWLGGDARASPVRRYAWLVAFAASCVAALSAGIMRPMGLLWIVLFAAATWRFARSTTPRWERIAACIAMVILAAGLMAHQLPGFDNPRVIPPSTLSEAGIPYRLHLNFDKTAVGVFVLGFCHPRIAQVAQWRTMLATAAPITFGVIALLMTSAAAVGYIRFDPKFPAVSWLWMWVNLCFTCVAEEALFRGFVQAQLQQSWRGMRHGRWLALSVASILFGLAHAGGGPVYVALATVAGAGYGWAYLRTGKIEASILTHFALNAVHFFGFTYPALRAVQ